MTTDEKTVAIVVTPAEYRKIQRAAALAGLSVWEWCRRVLLAWINEVVEESSSQRETLEEI